MNNQYPIMPTLTFIPEVFSLFAHQHLLIPYMLLVVSHQSLSSIYHLQ